MDTAPKSSPLSEAWQLGDWRVEPDLNRLTRGAEARLLEPKTMAVLVRPCRHHGEVVSSDELIAAVWDGRPMGDNPVYKSVAKLRRALDDDPTQPVDDRHGAEEGLPAGRADVDAAAASARPDAGA